MRRRSRCTLVAAPLLLALLATGCSSSPAEGSVEEERTTPLTEYFNAFYGGDLSEEEQQARAEEQSKEIEELTAACMSEQGFEYTPSTYTGSVVSSAEAEEWDFDSREWVAQYGYGMVEQPGSGEGAEPSEEYVDPNADHVASLTESEQAAYYEALSGPQPTEEEVAAMEDGSYEWDWTKAGCSGEAQHEAMGDDPMQSEEFEDVQEAITEFYEGQPTWPGMSELNSAWSSCMDEAGHPGFTAQGDAQQSIADRQNELWEAVGPEGGEVDQAALDALGEEEVEVALADFDCRAEVDYEDEVLDVTVEQEQRFVDDHEAELDAMKAAAEQGR